MLFNSIQFAIFFPVVVGIYFLIPKRFRWLFLLVASYFFYINLKAKYALILAFITLINYSSGLLIEKNNKLYIRKIYLVISLALSLAPLFFFKYLNFFNYNIWTLFQSGNLNYSTFNFIIPVGISFYTFIAIGYSIDVYRGSRNAEKNLGYFALYVSFFPQLLAGPIAKSNSLLPQFHSFPDFDYKRIADGLKLMAWGFFKKLIIADRLAIIVNEVYASPSQYHGFPLIITTYFYAFQVYCDFSGYSNIAIGAAKILGFELDINFNQPYMSRNITEFWRRWHITLGNWIRDYVYTPLSFSTRNLGMLGIYFSLIITFILVGLWHGAGWTYIAFGLLHGLALAFEAMTRKFRKKISKKINSGLYNFISIFITFNYVVLSYIFFRANTFDNALQILKNIFDFHLSQINTHLFADFGVGPAELFLSIFFIIILEIFHFIQRQHIISSYISSKPAWLRWGIYYSLILVIVYFGMFNKSNFIYFYF
ncbi:MAG: MBOAT family O-acyltransferase [Bacteroidales bacterium]|jgi:D-alanyl-lipoteichoic acid acyltransferase DltB (MBOAT superfamily)